MYRNSLFLSFWENPDDVMAVLGDVLFLALTCVLSVPCENGGTCQDLDGGNFTCECAEGYTGSTCETRK